jgi:hypothetical protein
MGKTQFSLIAVDSPAVALFLCCQPAAVYLLLSKTSFSLTIPGDLNQKKTTGNSGVFSY